MQEKQPFTLNHEGTTKAEVFGVSKEEGFKNFEEFDPYSDFSFGVVLFGALTSNYEGSMLVRILLGATTGLDLDRNSKITEYMVRSVNGADRKKLLIALASFSLSTNAELRDKVMYDMPDLFKDIKEARDA